MCDTQNELSTRADTSQCQSTHPAVTQPCLPCSSIWMKVTQRADLFARIIYVAGSWCKAQ